MANANNFLKPISGDNSVRDYKHANKTFVESNYQLSPRLGNLFHVIFEFTTEAVNLLDSVEKLELPLLVKTADLPQFTIQTETHNQYNRQVHSQQKINYSPISITFHDDQSDLIRSLWNTYYKFFFNDSKYSETASAYNTDNRYANRPGTSWGLQNGNVRFFRSIKIYSIMQQRFAEYTLINPSINAFNHDTHAYASTAMMQHVVQFNYEAVKYARGTVNNVNPKGFGEIRYDKEPSPLGSLANQNLYWNGNDLVNVANSALNDLASGDYLGALSSGINLFNNFENVDFKGILANNAENIASAFLQTQARGIQSGQTVFPKVNTRQIENSQRVTLQEPSVQAGTRITSNGVNITSTTHANIQYNQELDHGSATTLPYNSYNKFQGNKISDYQTLGFDTDKVNTIGDKVTQMQNRASSLTVQLNKLSMNPTPDNAQQRKNLLNEIRSLNQRSNDLQRFK